MPPGWWSSRPSPCTRPSAARVGRPPVLIALHRRAGVVAGIDFGKRHVRLAISDLSHALLAERHRALDADLLQRRRSRWPRRCSPTRSRRPRSPATRSSASAWGCPARCTGPRASSATRRSFPAGPGRAPRTPSATALGYPVEVENDANLGALGEWMWGAGRGADHMAYVKASTGIGAGFIVAGDAVRRRRRDGGRARPHRRRSRRPDLPLRQPRLPGDLRRRARRSSARCATSTATASRWRRPSRFAVRGDAGCQRAIADAGTAIGTAVATLCNLFNPHRVVVGGDLGAAGELLLAPLRESLVRGAIRSAAEDVTVVQGELGDRAEVLGAVALVLGRGAEASTS